MVKFYHYIFILTCMATNILETNQEESPNDIGHIKLLDGGEVVYLVDKPESACATNVSYYLEIYVNRIALQQWFDIDQYVYFNKSLIKNGNQYHSEVFATCGNDSKRYLKAFKQNMVYFQKHQSNVSMMINYNGECNGSKYTHVLNINDVELGIISPQTSSNNFFELGKLINGTKFNFNVTLNCENGGSELIALYKNFTFVTSLISGAIP